MPRLASEAGYARQTISIPVVLPAGTGAATLLPAIALGHQYEVEDAWYIPTVAATGAGASRSVRILRGSTVVATRTLVLADADTVGTDAPAFTVTPNLPFRDGDTLSIDVAAGGTAFTAGSGYVLIVARQRLQQKGN